MPPQFFTRSTPPEKLDFMIFSTVSCALPKEVWQQFPFDNDILIAEDQQWAKEILKNHMTIVYQPASCVLHSHYYSPRQMYRIKRKVGMTTSPFKNKFTAATVGLFLAAGGIITRVAGDIGYILFNRTVKLPFNQRIKEISTAIMARMSSFAGRYHGWQNTNYKRKKETQLQKQKESKPEPENE